MLYAITITRIRANLTPFEALVLLVGGAAHAAARAGLRRGRLGALRAAGANSGLPARRGSAAGELQAQLRHSPYLLVALHPCNPTIAQLSKPIQDLGARVRPAMVCMKNETRSRQDPNQK